MLLNIYYAIGTIVYQTDKKIFYFHIAYTLIQESSFIKILNNDTVYHWIYVDILGSMKYGS